MATAENPSTLEVWDRIFLKFPRAKEAATEIRRNGPIWSGADEASVELASCRDDIEHWLNVLLDGEGCIEHRWRKFCSDRLVQGSDDSGDDKAHVLRLFDQHLALLRGVQEGTEAQALLATLAEVGFPVRCLSKVGLAIERTVQIRDQVLGRWPLTERELAYAFPVDVEEVVYISPAAFLRSMATIVWNAFRHPFSTTYVDLSTGESVTFGDEAE